MVCRNNMGRVGELLVRYILLHRSTRTLDQNSLGINTEEIVRWNLNLPLYLSRPVPSVPSVPLYLCNRGVPLPLKVLLLSPLHSILLVTSPIYGYINIFFHFKKRP